MLTKGCSTPRTHMMNIFAASKAYALHSDWSLHLASYTPHKKVGVQICIKKWELQERPENPKRIARPPDAPLFLGRTLCYLEIPSLCEVCFSFRGVLLMRSHQTALHSQSRGPNFLQTPAGLKALNLSLQLCKHCLTELTGRQYLQDAKGRTNRAISQPQ